MTRKRTCPACDGRGERLEIDYERCYPASARMAVGPCDGCAGTGRIGPSREMPKFLIGKLVSEEDRT